MKSIQDIKNRISVIEADSRYQSGLKKPAEVWCNAPLALIQMGLESEIKTLKWILDEQNKDTVMIHISSSGDPSVGIMPIHETMQLSYLPDMDDSQERGRVRDIFYNAFNELLDDKVTIWFGDECPDCQALKKDCICPNNSEEVLR